MNDLKEFKLFLPLNIQFFAKGGEGEGEGNPNPNKEGGEGTPSLEEQVKQLQEQIKALEKEKESYADKRVNEALKKAKAKAEEERRKAEMSAEELLAEREKKVKVAELGIILRDTLAEEKAPAKLVKLFNTESFVGIEHDDFKNLVKDTIEVFNEVLNEQVEAIKQEYLKGKSPLSEKGQDTKKTLTKEDFKKMSVAEKTKLYNENYELYKSLKEQEK